MPMFIPYELAMSHTITKPSSKSLDAFESIAFDQVDGIASAWDQCTHDCPLPLTANRILSGAAAPSLREYEWAGCKSFAYDTDGCFECAPGYVLDASNRFCKATGATAKPSTTAGAGSTSVTTEPSATTGAGARSTGRSTGRSTTASAPPCTKLRASFAAPVAGVRPQWKAKLAAVLKANAPGYTAEDCATDCLARVNCTVRARPVTQRWG